MRACPPPPPRSFPPSQVSKGTVDPRVAGLWTGSALPAPPSLDPTTTTTTTHPPKQAKESRPNSPQALTCSGLARALSISLPRPLPLPHAALLQTAPACEATGNPPLSPLSPPDAWQHQRPVRWSLKHQRHSKGLAIGTIAVQPFLSTLPCLAEQVVAAAHMARKTPMRTWSLRMAPGARTCACSYKLADFDLCPLHPRDPLTSAMVPSRHYTCNFRARPKVDWNARVGVRVSAVDTAVGQRDAIADSDPCKRCLLLHYHHHHLAVC